MQYQEKEMQHLEAMENVDLDGLFISLGLLLVVLSLLGGCTFCLRYFTSMVNESNGPLHQAKKAQLKRTKANAQASWTANVESAPGESDRHDIKMTVITIDDIDSDKTCSGHALSSEDLRRFTLAPQIGDWMYYSDCQSCSSTSDLTLSPGGSPFVSPPGTPTGSIRCLARMNSEGSASYNPGVGRISEGHTLGIPDIRRFSAQALNENAKHGGGGNSRKSLDRPTLKRSLSVPTLPIYHFNPEVEFKIRYDTRRYSLVIEKLKALDLNLMSLKGYVYFKSDLIPTDKTRYSEIQCSNPNSMFNRVLIYEDLNESDIHKSSLLLTLFYSDQTNCKKACPIGEALVKVSELEITGEYKFVKRPLKRKRRRKKSTSSTSLFRELGELFLLLQYNSSANRIKVLVRKATHLPTGGKLPGQPDHSVTIDLMRNNIKVCSKETKPQKGSYPTWNEPFLFDIDGNDIDNYSLEFTVFRGRVYTKDNVLGHVVIGPNGTKAGTAHWQEASSPHRLEVAKWHTIMPVFKY